jgi:hypothetical protein
MFVLDIGKWFIYCPNKHTGRSGVALHSSKNIGESRRMPTPQAAPGKKNRRRTPGSPNNKKVGRVGGAFIEGKVGESRRKPAPCVHVSGAR